MRTIVHLSDIHFGQVDHALVEPLLTLVRALQPSLVAISGDLTQRARESEFREARAFLQRLPQPQIVVPGNHDVPLYDLIARISNPLKNYRRFITEDLQPFYANDEIAVAGINTARSLTHKGGRINRRQVAEVARRFTPLSREVVKVVVTHHPFDLPTGYTEHDLVGRARMAMEGLAACEADLFLSGHLHISHAGLTAERFRIAGHSALVVHAGTAISTRGRGEANAFNLIRIARPAISVQHFEWKSEKKEFRGCAPEQFQRTETGWWPATAGISGSELKIAKSPGNLSNPGDQGAEQFGK